MINIAYILDDSYYLPTKVSLNSLILNSSKKESVQVFLICSGVLQNKIQILKSLGRNNIKINIIQAEEKDIPLDAEHLYVSKAALLKFMLPQLLSTIKKVLYIDGDTIINGDISELFKINIADFYAGVVSDMIAVEEEKWHEKLGLENYFNSGVMLINLEKMRRDDLTPRLIEYKKNEPYKAFMDQNALNAVFKNCIKLLSPEYNFMLTNLSKYTVKKIADFFDTTEADLKNPAIYHFTGMEKPWNTTTARTFDLWSGFVKTEDVSFLLKSLNQTQMKSIESLKQKIDLLQNELNEIKNSKAWRIYNKVCRILRKVFRRNSR